MLPRADASAIVVVAATRACWALAAGILVLTGIALTGELAARGLLDEAGAPLLALAVMLVSLGAMVWRPTPVRILIHLVIGTACVYFYVVTLFDTYPELREDLVYFSNRPAVALVLIGAASARPLAVLGWGMGGWLAGLAATAAAFAHLGEPLTTGLGPTIAILNYCGAFLGLWLIRRLQRDSVPEFSVLQGRARESERERRRARVAAAIVHDTVLNDLAIVMNGPAKLDARARERMRLDVSTLAAAATTEPWPQPVAWDELDADFRNRMTAMISEFQWRGLTVEVSGSREIVLRVSPEVATACVGAVRACLENVLNHSGSTTAELSMARSDAAATIMVTDAGAGFDSSQVPVDRFGLRTSIIHRIESVGGFVRVWSKAGEGTSVMISVPLLPGESAP